VQASFPELGSRAAASSAYGHRVATPPLARPDRHTGPPGRIPVRSGGGCPADRRPDDDVEACRVTRRSRFSGLGSSSCEPTVEVPTVALAHRKSPRAPPGAEIGGSDVEPGQPPTDPSARPASPRVLAGRFHVHTRGDGTEEHSHRGLGLRRARRARTRGHERVLPERRLAEHATVEVPAWRGTTPHRDTAVARFRRVAWRREQLPGVGEHTGLTSTTCRSGPRQRRRRGLRHVRRIAHGGHWRPWSR